MAEAAATPRQLHDLAVRRVVDFQVALCALLLDDDRRQAMPLGLSRSLLRTLLCRGQLQPKLGFCLARRTCRACIHCWDADTNMDIWAWHMWECCARGPRFRTALLCLECLLMQSPTSPPHASRRGDKALLSARAYPPGERATHYMYTRWLAPPAGPRRKVL